MSFPASPSNGQLHTEGNQTWQYDSASNAWIIQSSAAGTDTDAYTHTQAAPATTWVVSHNLGYRPAGVQVENAGGDDITPEGLVHVNDNQLTIEFLVAVSGTAYVS